MALALNNIKRRHGTMEHRFECMVRGGVTYLRPRTDYTECILIEPGKGWGAKGKGKGKGKAAGEEGASSSGKKGVGKKGGKHDAPYSDDDELPGAPDIPNAEPGAANEADQNIVNRNQEAPAAARRSRSRDRGNRGGSS